MNYNKACAICKDKTLAKKTIEALINELNYLKKEKDGNKEYGSIYYDFEGKPIYKKFKVGNIYNSNNHHCLYEKFDSNKEWKAVKQIRDCIYNIQYLRLANLDKQPIFIASTEEEADTLKKMGFYSITFSNGLNNYKFIDNLKELLYESIIYIIQPHCENGNNIAINLAEYINSEKNTIKILNIDIIYPMLAGVSYIDAIYSLSEDGGCVIDAILRLINETDIYIIAKKER